MKEVESSPAEWETIVENGILWSSLTVCSTEDKCQMQLDGLQRCFNQFSGVSELCVFLDKTVRNGTCLSDRAHHTLNMCNVTTYSMEKAFWPRIETNNYTTICADSSTNETVWRFQDCDKYGGHIVQSQDNEWQLISQSGIIWDSLTVCSADNPCQLRVGNILMCQDQNDEYKACVYPNQTVRGHECLSGALHSPFDICNVTSTDVEASFWYIVNKTSVCVNYNASSWTIQYNNSIPPEWHECPVDSSMTDSERVQAVLFNQCLEGKGWIENLDAVDAGVTFDGRRIYFVKQQTPGTHCIFHYSTNRTCLTNRWTLEDYVRFNTNTNETLCDGEASVDNATRIFTCRGAPIHPPICWSQETRCYATSQTYLRVGSQVNVGPLDKRSKQQQLLDLKRVSNDTCGLRAQIYSDDASCPLDSREPLAFISGRSYEQCRQTNVTYHIEPAYVHEGVEYYPIVSHVEDINARCDSAFGKSRQHTAGCIIKGRWVHLVEMGYNLNDKPCSSPIVFQTTNSSGVCRDETGVTSRTHDPFCDFDKMACFNYPISESCLCKSVDQSREKQMEARDFERCCELGGTIFSSDGLLFLNSDARCEIKKLFCTPKPRPYTLAAAEQPSECTPYQLLHWVQEQGTGTYTKEVMFTLFVKGREYPKCMCRFTFHVRKQLVTQLTTSITDEDINNCHRKCFEGKIIRHQPMILIPFDVHGPTDSSIMRQFEMASTASVVYTNALIVDTSCYPDDGRHGNGYGNNYPTIILAYGLFKPYGQYTTIFSALECWGSAWGAHWCGNFLIQLSDIHLKDRGNNRVWFRRRVSLNPSMTLSSRSHETNFWKPEWRNFKAQAISNELGGQDGGRWDEIFPSLGAAGVQLSIHTNPESNEVIAPWQDMAVFVNWNTTVYHLTRHDRLLESKVDFSPCKKDDKMCHEDMAIIIWTNILKGMILPVMEDTYSAGIKMLSSNYGIEPTLTNRLQVGQKGYKSYSRVINRGMSAPWTKVFTRNSNPNIRCDFIITPAPILKCSESVHMNSQTYAALCVLTIYQRTNRNGQFVCSGPISASPSSAGFTFEFKTEWNKVATLTLTNQRQAPKGTRYDYNLKWNQ